MNWDLLGSLALVLVAVTSPLWYSHRLPGGRGE